MLFTTRWNILLNVVDVHRQFVRRVCWIAFHWHFEEKFSEAVNWRWARRKWEMTESVVFMKRSNEYSATCNLFSRKVWSCQIRGHFINFLLFCSLAYFWYFWNSTFAISFLVYWVSPFLSSLFYYSDRNMRKRDQLFINLSYFVRLKWKVFFEGW